MPHHGNQTTRYGNGAIKDFHESPANKARVRELLVECVEPKAIAKTLGLPKSLVSRWRLELLRDDPEFRELNEAKLDELKDTALKAFEAGIIAAATLAKSNNHVAAAQAAKVLVSAPAELARSQSKIDVAVSGSVSIESIDELKKRITGDDGGGCDDDP